MIVKFPYSFGEADHKTNQVKNKDSSDLFLALTWPVETAGQAENKRCGW